MSLYEDKVKECHTAMECAINEPMSIETLQLRMKLLNEELNELKAEVDTLCDELSTKNQTTKATRSRMLKELTDLQYVLSGLVVSFGLPLEESFTRVHNSNMSKLVDGKPLKRADGKFLKGPNYQPPYLDDLAETFK